ncbi:hypothetical protein [Novosphingobium cyanobacteriorum]|uniref:Uncharacterized protein n=1 Tax=Novosphingobium cyanobacteriorum TaxID=3024215 RepID=A0ABT6CNX3_9SPHN|nr:hypothetical protein [Novosphingobium cyanobacteriorum]MDF8334007.1 hypothetical protein [Novosphingobium cyanobacteriorum]
MKIARANPSIRNRHQGGLGRSGQAGNKPNGAGVIAPAGKVWLCDLGMRIFPSGLHQIINLHQHSNSGI